MLNEYAKSPILKSQFNNSIFDSGRLSNSRRAALDAQRQYNGPSKILVGDEELMGSEVFKKILKE